MKYFLKLVKRNTFIYKNISTLYHHTPHYKRYVEEKRQRGYKYKNLIKKYFNNDFSIKSGVFKGVNYLDDPGIGALVSKITGLYEYTIVDWIKNVIKTKYQRIVCLGSAEGYYAVGLAKKSPKSRVIASDISSVAQNRCVKMAKLNNCNNIKVTGKLTHDKLNNIIEKNKTLIICDIEGSEFITLDPEKCPNLLHTDIICELHDHLVNKNITDTLLQRFYETHKMEILVENRSNVSKINNNALKNLPKKYWGFVLNENRSGVAKWIRLLKR